MTIDARGDGGSDPKAEDGAVEIVEIIEGAALTHEPRGWRRVKAALLVELGRTDRRVAQRWQDEVVAGRFDADRAADEILLSFDTATADAAVERRCADLARDLVMAPRLRGLSGAARKAREAGRRGLAYLVVQILVVLVFVVLFAAGLLAARYAGHDLHVPIDRALSWIGLEPGQAGGS